MLISKSKGWISVLMFVTVYSLCGTSIAKQTTPEMATIDKHDLSVSFDLNKHIITAVDKVDILLGTKATDKLTFYINKTIKVESITSGAEKLNFAIDANVNVEKFERDEFTLKGSQAIIVTLPASVKPGSPLTLNFKYA